MIVAPGWENMAITSLEWQALLTLAQGSEERLVEPPAQEKVSTLLVQGCARVVGADGTEAKVMAVTVVTVVRVANPIP